MTWMILCLGGAVAVGFFGIAYFQAHPEQAGAVSDNPERVFIELAKILFNPWVAGVLLSAILAAVMSTLSCQLLVCSSALTEDFYKGLPAQGRQPAGTGLGRSRHGAVVAVIAIWLAANPENRVLGLVSYAWAGFGAAFGPLVLFSLLWKRMTRNGALAGMIGRGDSDPVEEPVGLDRPVRDHPRLPLRQRRHRRLQPARQGAFDEHAQALRRCGAGYREAHQGSAAPVTQR